MLTLNMKGLGRTNVQLLDNILRLSLSWGKNSCVPKTAGIRDRTQHGTRLLDSLRSPTFTSHRISFSKTFFVEAMRTAHVYLNVAVNLI